MDQFTLESSVPFLFDSGKADGSSTEKCPTIETYRHNGSGFRVVFVNMSSPLCSSTIIVPTLAEDNKGLPHTLEVCNEYLLQHSTALLKNAIFFD